MRPKHKRSTPQMVPVNLPAPPQPSALELRDYSSRCIRHLVDCLVDHIALFHQSEESALAALAFAEHNLRERIKAQANWGKPKT